METDKVDLKQLIISIIAVILLEMSGAAIISTGRFHPLFIQGLIRLVQTVMIILILLALGKDLSCVGLEFSVIFKGVIRGLVWSAAFGLIVTLGFVVLIIFKIDPRTLIHTGLPEGNTDMVLFFIVGGLLAPVAEEIFFRGILYGFFRRWGMAAALIISTSLFALAHFRGPGIPFTQLIGGILFAASYEREKSLLAPITIHILGNLAIFTMSI
jgi:membrane protease YdiL (CAAX protease family)